MATVYRVTDTQSETDRALKLLLPHNARSEKTRVRFVHEARTEPWGQTLARFISPEGLLIGLSYAPWLHQDNADST